MKTTLTTNEIASTLVKDELAGYSWSGALALAEHLEQIEDDCGIELELDVIALRCEFTEFKSVEDWADCLHKDDDQLEWLLEDVDLNDTAKVRDILTEFLEENHALISFEGGILISDY
jgi:hypothetical protein